MDLKVDYELIQDKIYLYSQANQCSSRVGIRSIFLHQNDLRFIPLGSLWAEFKKILWYWTPRSHKKSVFQSIDPAVCFVGWCLRQ